ncbi:hypothetical protein [Streptomyces flaveolus]|uniref:hypothetical protein n=1 Tax=Streptomyces flaveolus TaxID=67297 RepID=UPI0038235DC3
MGWWTGTLEGREPWALDPSVGVGPLRFGMSPDQVKAALDGSVPAVTQGADGRELWQQYGDEGVTAIYGPGQQLVAVAVDPMGGPQVLFEAVALIARTPSEARRDIDDLAHRHGETVRTNWSGDPEVAAWGVSLGTVQEWHLSAEGYLQRQDRVVTNALLVASDLTEDPYGSEPVIQWRDVRDEDGNSGAWPVTPERERPRWAWTPLESVGPLRFGMSPREVAAALENEAPAARRGHFPLAWYREPGQWHLNEDRFDEAGVTAHYWYPDGLPALGAVTLHGRTGPQVAFDGIDLIGQTVSSIDAAMIQRAENDEIGLVVGCAGDLGPDGLNMYVRAVRAGDAVISEARFCAADWEDHG